MHWTDIHMAIMTLAASVAQFATNWLIQSTLLIAVGLLLARLLRTHGSAVQSLVYRTTLVAVLVCPLATWALHGVGVSGWSVLIEPGYSFEQAPLTQTELVPAVEAAETVATINHETSESLAEMELAVLSAIPLSTEQPARVASVSETPVQSSSVALPPLEQSLQRAESSVAELWILDVTWFGLLSPAILVGWFAISMYLVSRLIASWWRMSCLVNDAHGADPTTIELCETLAKQLNVHSPGIRRSPFISSPCLAGLGLTKPANVLLPADDVDLPMRDVLVHELAHLRRHDCHWNLLRQLATSLCFFQPLLWMLSRRIEITAEEVCDDIVVHSGGDRHDYAHRLVDIAELSTELSAAAVAAAGVGIVSLRSMLARRVERILDTRRSLSTRVGHLLMIAVLLGGIGGTAMVGLVGLNENQIVADEQVSDIDDTTESTPNDTTNEASPRASYSGKVVDTQGNPVEGSDIYLTCYIPESTGLLTGDFKPITQSREDGRFDFTFAPSDLGPGVTDYEFRYNSLVAVKDGFGFAVAAGSKFREQKDIPMIALAPDHPIKGRIIDINGQPVAGARLTLFRVYSNDQHDLNNWNVEAEKPRSDFYKAREHVPTINSGRLVRSVVQPGVTNEKGEFTMSGIGKGRIARLLLEGDGIETQKVRVRTEPGGKITLFRESRSPDLGKWTYYPSHFEHICGPSIPVTGVVRDKASGKPLEGVTLKSQTIHGERISGSGSDFIRAVTDKDGRYRLTGLPIGSDNRIAAIVTDGEIGYPSQSQRADTSIAAGDLQEREVSFDMTPGVWLSGRITDADTGKGLTGQIQYYADASNPNSKLLRRGVDERDRLRPNDDGFFRFSVFPGKGYLAFLADKASDYPRASNITKPDGSQKPAPAMMDTRPSFLLTRNNNIVAEFHPQKGDTSYELDLTLGEGVTETGTVVGPDNQPINGFHYFGDTRSFSSWKAVSGNEFLLKGCRAGVPRHVYVVDAKRNLAGHAEVLGIPNETLQVEVAEAGSVKGRVVDEDGQPLAFRPLAPISRSVRNHGEMPSDAPLQPPLFAEDHRRGRFETDAEGRFEFKCLMPNTEYRLRVKPNEDPGYYRPLDIVIKVKAGEARDLGDVKVSDDPNLFRKTANQKKPITAAESSSTNPNEKVLGARVLLPDGKPAAETNVAVIGYDRDRGKAIVFAKGMTDNDGICKLTADGAMLSSGSDNPRTIIARRDGFGVGWKHLTTTAFDKPIDIDLKQEGIIEGKLIDIEGEPVAGEMLQIGYVFDPSIRPASTNGMASFYSSEFRNSPDAWLQPVTTDDKGWFRLTGVPKNHGVNMSLVNSERFAPQDIALNTGQKEERGERDGTYRPLVKNVESGEKAILTLSPAKVITGTITYEDTGEPVANGKMSVWASQQKYGSMTSVTCQTDADGKYRILPKPGIRFGVTAHPPGGVPYMARKAEPLDWENSDVTREVNIKLPRVVLVRGRVLDDGTDTPIAGAKITFERGENSSKLPENVITGWQAAQKTDADGKFTFAVPEGRGTLLIRKIDANYVMMHRMNRQIRYGLPGGTRVYAHAMELLQTKQADDTVDVEIRLKPGLKASGKIVDESGKLVDKSYIVTNLNVWDSSGRWRGGSNDNVGGKFELVGMDSDKDYPVYFLDAHRKLGATVNLRGGQENVTVKLKPCGTARAKFILDDPDRKFYPTLYFVASPGVGKYDRTKQKLGLIAADSDFNSNIDRINHRLPSQQRVTDGDDYYTFPALIPGATYRLITREDGDWSFKDFSVKSGETLDLGEFTPKFDD